MNTIREVLDTMSRKSKRFSQMQTSYNIFINVIDGYSILLEKGKSYDREDFPFTQSIAKTFHYEENDS